jgi:hypothetical protein
LCITFLLALTLLKGRFEDAGQTTESHKLKVFAFGDVTVPFLVYSIPKDMGLHAIFGIASGTVGLGLSGINSLKNRELRFIPGNHEKSPEIDLS